MLHNSPVYPLPDLSGPNGLFSLHTQRKSNTYSQTYLNGCFQRGLCIVKASMCLPWGKVELFLMLLQAHLPNQKDGL